MKRHVSVRLSVCPSVRPSVRLSVCPSVCLSVCLSQHGHTAANELLQGLLLWARRAGDIDRLVQQRRVAGECGQWHVVSVRTVGG